MPLHTRDDDEDDGSTVQPGSREAKEIVKEEKEKKEREDDDRETPAERQQRAVQEFINRPYDVNSWERLVTEIASIMGVDLATAGSIAGANTSVLAKISGGSVTGGAGAGAGAGAGGAGGGTILSGGDGGVTPVPPPSFTELIEQIGESDVTRRFALESGVAPGFRNFIQSRARREVLPFGIGALINNEIPEGGNLEDVISTRGFEEYLQNLTGRSNLGDTLRSASSFLGQHPETGPGAIGALGERQEGIRNVLFGEGVLDSGVVGQDRFNKLINLVSSQRGRGRSVGGFNISGAVNRSLRNTFARNPGRFETAPEFIEYLTQQGLI